MVKRSTARIADLQHFKPLLLMVGVSIIVRVAFWLIYEPARYGDSGGYFDLAARLAAGDLSGYNGTRTPMYPLLVMLASSSDSTVWVFQMVLGLLNSLLLYYLVYFTVSDVRISMLVGLSVTIVLNLLFFEAAMLTESLSALLVIVSLAAATLIVRHREPTVVYGLLGSIVALIGLTRPFMLIVVVVYLVAIIVLVRDAGPKQMVVRMAAFLMPVVVIVGTWSTIVYRETGYFGLTTLTGYNLMQHSGKFIDNAPAEYATIRDVYLEFRDLQDDNRGAIWQARPALMEATGQSIGPLSQTLTTMSLRLFASNPIEYLTSASWSWGRFWGAPNYWEIDLIKPDWLRPFLEYGWMVERLILWAFNVFFLGFSAYALYRVVVKRNAWPHFIVVVAIGVVLSSSIFQALTESGENPRYSIPFQSLVLFSVTVGVHQLVSHFRRRRAQVEERLGYESNSQTRSKPVTQLEFEKEFESSTTVKRELH